MKIPIYPYESNSIANNYIHLIFLLPHVYQIPQSISSIVGFAHIVVVGIVLLEYITVKIVVVRIRVGSGRVCREVFVSNLYHCSSESKVFCVCVF